MVLYCCLPECGEAIGVGLSHAADVQTGMAFRDEVTQNCLIEEGGKRSVIDLATANGFTSLSGQNYITKAEIRKEHFVKAPREDDADTGIQSLQGGQRSADAAKLAVIVVLKDPCSGFAPSAGAQAVVRA